MIAYANGSKEIIGLLETKGADKYMKDDRGKDS